MQGIVFYSDLQDRQLRSWRSKFDVDRSLQEQSQKRVRDDVVKRRKEINDTHSDYGKDMGRLRGWILRLEPSTFKVKPTHRMENVVYNDLSCKFADEIVTFKTEGGEK